MRAPIGNEVAVKVTPECLPFPDPDASAQRIAILVNGTELNEITLQPGVNSHSVVIPREMLRYRRNHIGFRYAHTIRPVDVVRDSTDERELAVAWYSIRFEEDFDAEVGVERSIER